MKIRIPKYLLFKIFESFEEVFLFSRKNIFLVYDGKIVEKREFDSENDSITK